MRPTDGGSGLVGREATTILVYSVERHYRRAEEVEALFRDKPREERERERVRPRHKRVWATMGNSYRVPGRDEPVRISGLSEGMLSGASQVKARLQAGQELIELFDGQRSLETMSEACLEAEFGQEVPRVEILEL